MNIIEKRIQLNNNIFSNNSALNNGGTIFQKNVSEVTINNCIFGDSKSIIGGDLYIYFTKNIIIENTNSSNSSSL